MNDLSKYQVISENSKIENQILCGDNLEILPTISNESIKLTVSSPPYDKMRDYQGYSWDLDKLIPELWRVTMQNGIVAWVVADQCKNGNESLTSLRQAIKFQDFGWKVRTLYIAKNNFSQPDNCFYHRTIDYCFIFVKGKLENINFLIDKKNKNVGKQKHNTYRNRKTGKKIKKQKTQDIKEYGKRYNFWNYIVGGGNVTKDKIAYDHDALMPEKLAEDLILSFSNPDDIILDIFNGAGTTTKMAYLNHRKFIGIELSEEYCKIARKRLMIGRPLKEDYLKVLPERLNRNICKTGKQQKLL